MTQEQKGFAVTVAGQYYAGTGRDKLIKSYKAEVFYIPEVVEIAIGRKYVEKQNADGKKIRVSVPDKKSVSGKTAALHVIQRRFLAARLQERYPDYTGFRTCQIIDIKPSVIPAEHVVDITRPVKNMNLVELKTICAMESLNTNPSMFADLDDARSAVASELAENRKKAGARRLVDEKPVEDAPVGVGASYGAVTSDDGVPTDEEDPAAGLM